jgi:hypothetical protein
MFGIYKWLFAFILLLIYTPPIKAEITLDFHYPTYEDQPLINHFPCDWKTVPGAVHLDLVGIHDMVISYLQRRLSRYAEDQLWLFYNESNISEQKLYEELIEVNSKLSYYGDWWDRPWFYSLPPEKNGAPRKVQKIEFGWELTIPKSMPILGWLKEKFESIGDIWLTDERAYVNIKDQQSGQLRSNKQANDPETEIKEPINAVIEGSSYAWYRGLNYHLRFRPTIRVSPGIEWRDILNEYSFKIVIEIFIRNHTIHFADIMFIFRHNLKEEIMSSSLTLSILTW